MNIWSLCCHAQRPSDHRKPWLGNRLEPVSRGGAARSGIGRLGVGIGTTGMCKLQRQWTELKRGGKGRKGAWWRFGEPATRKAGFKVLQWNVLADGLAQNGNFINVPKEALEWEVRWPLILEELEESNADIICMQELNKHDDVLKPTLLSKGYDSYFLAKPQSPAENYNKKPDGCAVFYKHEKFKLVGQPRAFHYQDTEIAMNQGCAALCLEDKELGRRFVVATTHLKAKNGDRNMYARMRQVSQLMDFMEEMRVSYSKNGSDAPDGQKSGELVPVLICGDFNDTPESPPCAEISKSDLGLRSLWNVGVRGKRESELITTFKHRPGGESRRIIDYIWFTSDSKWTPTKRWLMPCAREIGPKGLPGYHYASDHLALCAEFEWL